MLPGARKDAQIITSTWHKPQRLIDGVLLREVLHVPGDAGVLTEMYRTEWDPADPTVAQVFQRRLTAGTASAWHCHLRSRDRLFVADGQARIVLYDDREGSPTRTLLNQFQIGEPRPALVVVPAGVWHGVGATGGRDALVLNFPNLAYQYEDPDHWRIPADSPAIPFRWSAAGYRITGEG